MDLLAAAVPGVPIGAWLVTILFLGVLAAVAYWLVHLVRQGQGPAGQASGMRIVGRLPLSMNQSLVLVAVGEEFLLLGVGQRVELIERIEDPQTLKALWSGLEERGPAPSAIPFANAIGRLQETDFRGILEDSLRRIREARILRRDKGDGDA